MRNPIQSRYNGYLCDTICLTVVTLSIIFSTLSLSLSLSMNRSWWVKSRCQVMKASSVWGSRSQASRGAQDPGRCEACARHQRPDVWTRSNCTLLGHRRGVKRRAMPPSAPTPVPGTPPRLGPVGAGYLAGRWLIIPSCRVFAASSEPADVRHRWTWVIFPKNHCHSLTFVYVIWFRP